MKSTRNEQIKKNVLKDAGQGTYQILVVILILLAIVALLFFIFGRG